MKKTNKENPITFFRKANEARQAKVKKSLKKAQDGIQVGPITEEQSKSRSSETPRVINEPIKMQTKKNKSITTQDMDRNRFKGSVFSREGKKKGESYYRKMGEPSVLHRVWMSNNDEEPGYIQRAEKLKQKSTYKKGGAVKRKK
jgi:hypothetical protein